MFRIFLIFPIILSLKACGEFRTNSSHAGSSLDSLNEGLDFQESKSAFGLPFGSSTDVQIRNRLWNYLQSRSLKSIINPPCSYNDQNSCIINNFDQIQIEEPENGVYYMRWRHEVNSKDPSHIDKDRWEINFSKKIGRIYGLGNLTSIDGIHVEDFLDTRFSNGHLVSKGKEFIDADMLRMKLPIFVFPTLKMMIVYFTPAIKIVKLERSNDNTQIIMKRRTDYPLFNAENSNMAFIFDASVEGLYAKYYRLLKKAGRPFKKPLLKTFGLNWQTYGETFESPNYSVISNAMNRYQQHGLKMESLTIGSGYWTYQEGQNHKSLPYYDFEGKNRSCFNKSAGKNEKCVARQMEVFTPNSNIVTDSKGETGGRTLPKFFDELASRDIYPIIGMRHSPRAEYAQETYDHIKQFASGHEPIPASGIYYHQGLNNDQYTFIRPFYSNVNYGNIFTPLQVWNNGVMNSYIAAMKNAYGNFRGIKEDDMWYADQDLALEYLIDAPSNFRVTRSLENFGMPGTIQANKFPHPGANLPEGFFSPVFDKYQKYQRENYSGDEKDMILMGSNPYYSFNLDAVNIHNWVPEINNIYLWGDPNGNISKNWGYRGFYDTKFGLDRILSTTLSGYVHPYFELGYSRSDVTNNCAIGKNIKSNASAELREYGRMELLKYVREQQLNTFMPVSMYSCGFWHLLERGQIGNTEWFAAERTEAEANLYHETTIYFMKLRMRLKRYAYDNAMTWYNTGVPSLVKPLFIDKDFSDDNSAYSQYNNTPVFAIQDPNSKYLTARACHSSDNCINEEAAKGPMNEFLFGDAFLIRPILHHDASSVRVYFPKGKWVSIFGTEVFNEGSRVVSMANLGPNLMPYPVFLREKRIAVVGKHFTEPTNSGNTEILEAWVYLSDDGQSTPAYLHYDKDGNVKAELIAARRNGKIYLRNKMNACESEMTSKFEKAFVRVDLSKVLACEN